MQLLFALQEHSDLRLWVSKFLIVEFAQLVTFALKCVLNQLFVHLVSTVLKPRLLCYLVLQALSALATGLLQALIAVPASEVASVS
jgi:hypothetical protein